jgi:hypothetical protein
LSHTHEIDFSGTGGSSNMLNNKRKADTSALLGNLLESGKFIQLLIIARKTEPPDERQIQYQ